jgi:UDP-N-acetylmuramate dehydrogenase
VDIMMAAARIPSFIDTLPPLRGRVQADAPLAPFSWFRVGGLADALVRPASEADLAQFLNALPLEIPVHVIGACSNLIIRDGGLPGVVIRLARGFGAIGAEPDGVIAGGAALDVTIAEHAAAAGLTGLEFLSGIPGSIGGAVVMNGGAYGGDIASCLDWADIVTRTGEQRRLAAADLAFAYRHSRLPHGAVVVRARLRARRGAPEAIAARMAEIRAAREATQPIRARTGGSTFRNPPDMKAWELIEAAGCRGLTRGGALVSEKHCNFLINTGNATAADLEGLGEEVRRRVHAATGVTLEWEIHRIGVPGGRPGTASALPLPPAPSRKGRGRSLP